MVLECWQNISIHFINARLDEFKIMPTHLHGIIEHMDSGRGTIYRAPAPAENIERFSNPVPGSIPTILRTFKAALTRQIGEPIWQRGYYEYVVRNAEDRQRIRNYIGTQYLREDHKTKHLTFSLASSLASTSSASGRTDP